VSIFDSQFVSNTAKLDGGAIYVGQGNGFGITQAITIQAIRIDGCDFTSNTAYGNGGMMFLSVLNAVTMDSPIAYRNLAYKDGGAIYLNSLNYVSITHGTFIENAAMANGGGLASADSNSVWLYTQADFLRNSAGMAGGAVHEQSFSNIMFWNGTSSFIGNQANREGGAIAVLSADLALLAETLFQDNDAGRSNSSFGGAIMLGSGNLDLGRNNFTFVGNRAADGSAWHLRTSTVANVNIRASNESIMFRNNLCYKKGGTISWIKVCERACMTV
jgi:predicted outer membrane repeat protein